MRTLYVSYTYLDIAEVDDNATNEEIEEILKSRAPAEWYNDIEWGNTDEHWNR